MTFCHVAIYLSDKLFLFSLEFFSLFYWIHDNKYYTARNRKRLRGRRLHFSNAYAVFFPFDFMPWQNQGKLRVSWVFLNGEVMRWIGRGSSGATLFLFYAKENKHSWDSHQNYNMANFFAGNQPKEHTNMFRIRMSWRYDVLKRLRIVLLLNRKPLRVTMSQGICVARLTTF